MMELLGADWCESCLEAKKFMGKTPLEWKYVDVEKEYKETIPRLILENGKHIVGLPAIEGYVKKRMREEGFPPEMIS